VIFLNMVSETESQALHDLTQRAVGRVAQRAWMVLWNIEHISVIEIAALLHCRPKTVRKWLRRYQRGGVLALSDLPRRGRPTTETAVTRQAVFTQLNQPPSCSGYICAIWTVATLCQHLAARCGLRLSRWKVRQLLLTLRYRFTRPRVAPRRVDPQRDEIQQQIGRKIAEVSADTAVLIEDETDIRLFPVLRRMWQRINEQVRLVAPLQNEKRTVFGTINIHTGEVFHRIFSRKRTLEMIAFCEDLLVHHGARPVLVILDHASIHKSRALREWLLEHPQLELIYLPRYGGHQDNPIEKLWWHLKGYAAANRCCRSMAELISIVERYFAQLTPEKVIQLVA
jgi:transposase